MGSGEVKWLCGVLGCLSLRSVSLYEMTLLCEASLVEEKGPSTRTCDMKFLTLGVQDREQGGHLFMLSSNNVKNFIIL